MDSVNKPSAPARLASASLPAPHAEHRGAEEQHHQADRHVRQRAAVAPRGFVEIGPIAVAATPASSPSFGRGFLLDHQARLGRSCRTGPLRRHRRIQPQRRAVSSSKNTRTKRKRSTSLRRPQMAAAHGGGRQILHPHVEVDPSGCGVPSSSQRGSKPVECSRYNPRPQHSATARSRPSSDSGSRGRRRRPARAPAVRGRSPVTRCAPSRYCARIRRRPLRARLQRATLQTRSQTGLAFGAIVDERQSVVLRLSSASTRRRKKFCTPTTPLRPPNHQPPTGRQSEDVKLRLTRVRVQVFSAWRARTCGCACIHTPVFGIQTAMRRDQRAAARASICASTSVAMQLLTDAAATRADGARASASRPRSNRARGRD